MDLCFAFLLLGQTVTLKRGNRYVILWPPEKGIYSQDIPFDKGSAHRQPLRGGEQWPLAFPKVKHTMGVLGNIV